MSLNANDLTNGSEELNENSGRLVLKEPVSTSQVLEPQRSDV